jgi:hypothetical protein
MAINVGREMLPPTIRAIFLMTSLLSILRFLLFDSIKKVSVIYKKSNPKTRK